MNSILYCFEFPVHLYPTHFCVNPITTSEFEKLYNDIKHEWFSLGPGGHIKGKNGQSEGGSSPEEGGGETISVYSFKSLSGFHSDSKIRSNRSF